MFDFICIRVHDVIENMVPSQVEGVASNAAPYESTDFTKDEQFTGAQNNNVPGSNQESCVGAFNEQYCAQGDHSEQCDFDR